MIGPGVGRARCVSSFILTCLPPSSPKQGSSDYERQTPRHPSFCPWTNGPWFLPADVCFWDQGTGGKSLCSLPGCHSPQNPSTPTSVPPLCRGPERNGDLPKFTQQEVEDRVKPTFPVSWLGTYSKKRFWNMSSIRWMSPAWTPAMGLHPHDPNALARRPRPVPPRDLSFLPDCAFLSGAGEGNLGEDKRGQLCIKYLGRRHPLENCLSSACCPLF